MRVALREVAPSIDDPDHGFAREIVALVAHLQHTRAMPERTQVRRTEPAVAAQILGRFPSRHGRSLSLGGGSQAPAPTLPRLPGFRYALFAMWAARGLGGSGRRVPSNLCRLAALP